MSLTRFIRASGSFAVCALLGVSSHVLAKDLGEIDPAARIAALEKVLDGAAAENAVCRDLYESFLGAVMAGVAPPSELVDAELFKGDLSDLSESDRLAFTAFVLEATLGWSAYEMAWARSVGMPYDKVTYTNGGTVKYSAHADCRRRLQPALEAMAILGVTVEAAHHSLKESD